jgi:hypothetical protein
MDLQCSGRVSILLPRLEVTFSEFFKFQRRFHNLGKLQVGRKGARLHSRQGMFDPFFRTVFFMTLGSFFFFTIIPKGHARAFRSQNQ